MQHVYTLKTPPHVPLTHGPRPLGAPLPPKPGLGSSCRPAGLPTWAGWFGRELTPQGRGMHSQGGPLLFVLIAPMPGPGLHVFVR